MPGITMKEIAKRAGVAQPTVSKVLNNKYQDIKPETRERVLKVIKELSYQPNYMASSLRSGKTYNIGLTGGNILNFHFRYFSDIAACLEDALNEADPRYSLIIFGANYSESHEKAMELIKTRMTDGLVFVVLSEHIDTFIQETTPFLNSINLPFVAIHSVSQDFPFNNVGVDTEYGGYLAGKYLAKKGRKDIRLYGHNYRMPQIQDMEKGVSRGLAEHGLAYDRSKVIFPSRTAEPKGYCRAMIRSAYQTIMELDTCPEALVVPHDDLAIGAARAVRDKGLRVGKDMDIVYFNTAEPNPYLEKELPYVTHPVKEKSAAAMKMLLGILEQDKETGKIHQELIKPELIVPEESEDRATEIRKINTMMVIRDNINRGV